MKKSLGLALIAIVAIFSMTSTTIRKDNGIKFQKLTFEEALEKADKSGKYIFVDAYTSWCGPCKYMAANTFTDEEVGEFFNENFVNLKIDMEKGEGPVLARTYKVRAYPTLLILDGQGNVVRRTMGAKKKEALIAFGQSAL